MCTSGRRCLEGTKGKCLFEFVYLPMINQSKMNFVDKLSLPESCQSLLRRVLVLAFLVTTGVLFVYLNHVQPYYFIDEVFHIPQTQRYCEGKFLEWDNKITTLPGLYVITSTVLAPLGLCNTTCIRCTNLVGTFFNLFLVYEILRTTQRIHYKKKEKDALLRLVASINIVLFPPLYFWLFLYYTDVVSVNMVLLMFLLHRRSYFKTAACTGALSILVRQTNVVWVALLAVEHALDLIEAKSHKPVPRNKINTPAHLKLLWDNVKGEFHKDIYSIVKFATEMSAQLAPYIIVGLGFILFVKWNEGIVVGDRSAHVPTIHLPQIFYFSSFAFCFAWPYMILHWKSYLRIVKKHWVLASVTFGAMTMIIHHNTLVHPYLLADNRHYTFYVWNRLMGRYILLRYLLIPIYGFTMYSMMICMSHVRFVSQIGYLCSVCLVLVPQLLIEPRYFIIPYLFFRLYIQKPQPWQVFMELLTALTVNGLQFYVFVNKVFYWSDQEHPQRISW